MEHTPSVEVGHPNKAQSSVDKVSGKGASAVEVHKPAYWNLDEPHYKETHLVFRKANNAS